MEFGIFIQGYLPGPQAHDSEAEHRALLREADLVQAADRNNWKFVWLSEHHTLTEYSHLSASEVYAGYLACRTQRIHVGSGIFNLSPRVNHPVRVAERVALLDHLYEGRFEFGTGRGAGSHEVETFNIQDPSSTRSEWDEVVWQIPKMWERKDYAFQGDHFEMHKPHNVLPKPYGNGHPAMWVACGNPATFGKAGEHGIGALGFTFAPIYEMQAQIDAYKEGISNCREAVGQFVNDNVMLTSGVRCCDDRRRAREQATRHGSGYLPTLVNLYHDSFVKPAGSIRWPDPPMTIPSEAIDDLIAGGYILCGTPEEVCEQLQPFVSSGVDQLVFGTPNDVTHDEALEMIELFGQQVIPEFDKDPEVSTIKYRRAAKPKYGPFEKAPPAIETIWTR
jgi:alkanesulfonate monooxygenase SsuD/methylene tetrahydromethanopterin reductase-like flavin-dependent oxidoreductase (luciferase family)